MSRLVRVAVLSCAVAAGALFPPALRAACGDDLGSMAMAAYHKGDFAAASRLFDEAIGAGLDDTSTLYNAACSHALAGHADEAIARLDEAVSNGFIGCEMLDRDADFVSLRSDPRWKTMTAACVTRKEAHERFWNAGVWKTTYRENLPDAEGPRRR